MTKDQNRSACIEIKTMGEFSIRMGDHTITDEIGRIKKVWMLIEYLIAHRQHAISQEKLIEVLWSEEECDNPIGALKNLVYRARTILKGLDETIGPALIQYVRNTYAWNNGYPCAVDAESFEETYRNACKTEQSEAKTSLFLRAVGLYHGEFLPKSSYADWVVSKNAYYASLYTESVLQSCYLLKQQEDFERIILICEKAIQHDPFEERIHCYLLESYAKMAHYNKAVTHYDYITKLFYKEFGINLSDETKHLYKQIIKDMHRMEMDLSVIREDLREACAKNKGAYFCTDYEIFQSIYQVQARLIMRTGFSIHTGLITLTDRTGKELSGEKLRGAMQDLCDIVLGNLRKGDVVCQYNSAQLVLMLPMTTYENSEMILNRLITNFRKINREKDIELHTMLCLVEPVEG